MSSVQDIPPSHLRPWQTFWRNLLSSRSFWPQLLNSSFLFRTAKQNYEWHTKCLRCRLTLTRITIGRPQSSFRIYSVNIGYCCQKLDSLWQWWYHGQALVNSSINNHIRDNLIHVIQDHHQLQWRDAAFTSFRNHSEPVIECQKHHHHHHHHHHRHHHVDWRCNLIKSHLRSDIMQSLASLKQPKH